jgi:aspartyl-tRNA synthetase
MAAMISGDLCAGDLLMGAPSDVAPKRLRVLHIRLNLPEN